MPGNPETLSTSLLDSIKDSKTIEITPDLLEIGIDELFTSNELLKEIPVIKIILAIYKDIVTLSDKILIKKILLFLKRLETLTEEEKDNFYNRLNADYKFKKKVGEKILLLLDKSDDFEKSYLVAEVFKVYIKGEIDYNKFQLLSNAIINTFIGYVKKLDIYYTQMQNRQKVEQEILESLFQGGLLGIESHMVFGDSGIEYKPNKLGIELVKILFS